MTSVKSISTAAVLAVAVGSAGCGQNLLSGPPTAREQTAAMGGLAGGATGAIIGSLAGGAVAGGLFGIPLGAVAGYYLGDQLASQERAAQSRTEEQDMELDRLRRENERLRREEDRPATSQLQQGQESRSSAQATIRSEENSTSSQPSTAQQDRSATQQESMRNQQGMADSQPAQPGMAGSKQMTLSRTELRQVQQKLNDTGFDAGQVDGMWGPNTQAALRNFQQARGLEATGRPNEQTLNALGIADGNANRGTLAAGADKANNNK